MTITFGATVSQTLGFVANSAVISGGGEIITRTATITVEGQICNLTKYTGNPVLSTGAGGSWDDDDVRGPAVLKEGSSYKMWYTGDDGSNPSRIGLATSTDGVNWTKDAANPVLSPSETWEANGVMAGGVISDSGLYKMWYTGYDSSWVGRIGYATSPDGVTWTKYGSNPVLDVGAAGGWEDEDVMEPTVIKEGSTYHIWYRGYDGMTARIGHATSSDGASWTKDTANPVLDVGPPGGWDWLDVYGPSVVKVGAEYKLWYSGETLPQAWQTGYALSSDGSDWTRQGMLLPEGASGAFDSNSADYPSVIVDGAGFKVWYSGHDGDTYTIGYATAETCAASSGSFIYLPIVMKSWGPCPAYYTDDFGDPGSAWPVDDDVVFGLNEDWSEYYEVVIDANYHSIWRYDGSWIALRDWTSSGYINTGTSWNRLKVIREGTSIAVYVNDQYLTTVILSHNRRAVSSFALPFYAPGYLLSAVALAVASSERSLALAVYSAGVVLYALSAWAFRETVFLYPAAWLAAVPYYLAMTFTPLEPRWGGLGWLPLIVGYIALGRFVFHKAPLGIKNRPTFLAALAHPALPFYLLAYALSASMIALSQGDPLTLTLALVAGAVVYFGSAALFRRPVWLYPGLLAAHLALMVYFTTTPWPAYYITLPFLGMTWATALVGYGFSRRFPVVRRSDTGLRLFRLWRWELDFGSWLFVGHLVTPSWAQPFFIFAALDLVLWQALALHDLETAIILAAGNATSLGLLAMLWQDTALAYGMLGFFLLAVGCRLRWAALPFAEALAWMGGIGFGLYLLARMADRCATHFESASHILTVWPKPLTHAAMFLTAVAVIATLPTVATHTTATAAALAFAGALYLAISYRGQHYRLGYLGMAMLQLAWALALIVQDVKQPQWYAIPAGLYFTGVGYLERRRGRGLFPIIVEGFGLAVLLVTSFIQSLNAVQGFPYFVLLLVEGLVVIWWGAWRRLKAPFFTGLGASALNVVAQVVVLVIVHEANRWFIILGVGLLLMIAAVFVERQSERIIARAQEWREELERWE